MDDLRRELEAHIASAKRAGASPEGQARAGILFLTIRLKQLRRKLAVKQAADLLRVLPALAGKAATADDQLAVLNLRVELGRALAEQREQDALARKGHPLGEGKSFFFPAEQDRDVERLLREIGGRRIPGAEPGPGGFDGRHFNRVLDLIGGDAEPSGDAETRALERFRRKWGTP